MRPAFWTFLCLLPLALGAATLSRLARTGLAPPGPESLTELWLSAVDQAAEEEVGKADQRMEAKRPVIAALLDGRLTLRQAAARFREIDVGRSAQAQAWALPGWTEEEWACRQVISYVDSELAIKRRNPALAKEWVARLEAELRGHLRHAGAPRLHPDREPQGEPDH